MCVGIEADRQKPKVLVERTKTVLKKRCSAGRAARPWRSVPAGGEKRRDRREASVDANNGFQIHVSALTCFPDTLGKHRLINGVRELRHTHRHTHFPASNQEQPMSLMFKNKLVPGEYQLSLAVTDAKPNYSGKLVIPLVPNGLYNEVIAAKDAGSQGGFTICLNTAEIISLGSVLKCGDKSWKLTQTTDKEAQFTTYSTTEVSVDDLDVKSTTIEITFMAVIRKILTYKDTTKGVFSTKYTDPTTGKSDRWFLSTHSQPHFARYIFPCLDDINLKCPIQLKLTVDDRFTCISNMPIESSDLVSGTRNKTVLFKTSPPMTTSVFSFAIGDFECIENTVELPISKSSLPLKIYTMVGESERASHALSVVSKAIIELETQLKYPYPLPKLDFVAAPFLSDGGVENWSMIQIINDHILLPDWKVSDAQLQRQKKTITDVVVHEIIHMYVGNLITFDSYDHTWLNESFATFMSTSIINSIFDKDAWFNHINDNMNATKLRNLDADSKPIAVSNVLTEKAHDTFSRNSYDKGIFLMRTLASLFNETDEQLSTDNYSTFFSMMGDFIKIYKYNTFKPIDLWNFLKNHTSNKYSYDIPTIMNSWIRNPGFPRLTVTKEESGSIKIEQHRCMDDLTEDIEDVPFHIPLLIKTSDGKIGRQLLNDRSLIISNENLTGDFIYINANDSAMINVEYPDAIYKELSVNIGVLNRTEQLAFFKDFASIIGTDYQTKESISSFFKVMKSIKKINKVDPVAMTFALSILSNVYKSINTLSFFEDPMFYKRVNSYIDELSNKYISQLEWETINWSQLTTAEIGLRNAVLSLKYDNHSTETIGKKLFKKVMHGPKNSIPAELLNSVFTIVAHTCSLKDYKEIHKLVRNPGLCVNNVIGNNSSELQTAAINCLGFMTSDELRHKTLMFVTTNPDIKMIELALLGFRFQMPFYADLWKWYKSNYNVWYSKYARDNKSYQGLFYKHISELVLECAYYDSSLRDEVDAFVKSRNADFKEWLEDAKDKLEIAKFLSQANENLKSTL